MSAFSKAYNQLSFELFSKPCYAARSTGPVPPDFDHGDEARAHSEHFQTEGRPYSWKPSASGLKYRHGLWMSLWFAILVRYAMSIIGSQPSFSILRYAAPPLMACLLAVFTTKVTAAELQRDNYRVNSDAFPASSTDALHRKIFPRLLKLYRRTVLFLVVPLLSLPIYDTRYVSETSSWLSSTSARSTAFSFPSWSIALQDIITDIPVAQKYGPAPFQELGHSQHPRIYSPFRDPAGDDIPQVLRYSSIPAERYQGATQGWLAGEAVMMPILTTRARGRDYLTQLQSITTERLSMQLDCAIYSEEASRSPKGRTLLGHPDSSCESTSIDFKTRDLDEHMRKPLKQTYEIELDRLNQTLQAGNLRPQQEVTMKAHLRELVQDLEVLKSGSPQVFEPQWLRSQDSSDSNNCKGALWFVGTVRPILRSNWSHTEAEQISIAGCTTRYALSSKWQDIHRHPRIVYPPSSQHPKLAYDTGPALHFADTPGDPADAPGIGLIKMFFYVFSISMPRILESLTYLGPKEESEWTDVDPQLKLLIDDALLGRFISQNISDRLWAEQLLELEYLRTGQMEYGIGFPPLLLATKRLCSQAVDLLAESLSTTLSRLAATKSPLLAYMPYSRGEARQFVSQDLFWNVKYQVLVLSLACFCTAIIRRSSAYTDDSPTGLPWSIATIGARALLLVNSRVGAAFRHGVEPPARLRDIPYLRFGCWAPDRTHAYHEWRLDSMCNSVFFDESTETKRREGSLGSQRRHAVESLPATFRGHSSTKTILSALLACVACVAFTVSRDTFTVYGWSGGVLLTRLVLEDLPFQPPLGITVLLVGVPVVLTMGVFAMWSDLDIFYSRRQAWAELCNPSLARDSLTLDFSGSFLSVRKAVASRHWRLLAAKSGYVPVVLLPLLAANLFKLFGRVEIMQDIALNQNRSWRTNIAEQQPESNATISAAGIDAVLNAPAELPWTLGTTAILPLNLDTVSNQIFASPGVFWQIHTTWIESSLKCTLLDSEKSTGLQDPGAHDDDRVSPISITSWLPPDLTFSNGAHDHTVQMCDFGMLSIPSPRAESQSLLCTKCDFLSLRNSTTAAMEPSWLITLLPAQIKSWQDNGSWMKYHYDPVAMLCVPRIRQGQGQVRMFDEERWSGPPGRRFDGVHTDPDRIPHFKVRDIIKREEMTRDASYSVAFGRMLNESLQQKKVDHLGYALPSGPIIMPGYVGDTMGYLLHRHLQSRGKTLSDLDAVMSTISHIYGLLFAATASETEWLTVEEPTVIDIAVLRWLEEFQVRKLILYPFVGLLSLVLVAMLWLGIVPKKYLFPADPELLENSLFFLYQSSIPESLKRIRHPEKLSIEEVHRKIEEIGDKYMFDRVGESTHNYKVDRVEAFRSSNQRSVDAGQPHDEQDDTNDLPFANRQARNSRVRDVSARIRGGDTFHAEADNTAVELQHLLDDGDDEIDGEESTLLSGTSFLLRRRL